MPRHTIYGWKTRCLWSPFPLLLRRRGPGRGGRLRHSVGANLSRKTSENSPSPIGWERAGVRVHQESRSTEKGWHEAKERAGKDGFHSVPNGLKKEWDGVESVLTVPWQAVFRIVEASTLTSCDNINEKT